MELAMLRRRTPSLARDVYEDSLTKELSAMGIDIHEFEAAGPIPDSDIVWDPGLGMGGVPRILRRARAPLVATLHGVRAFSLPRSERDWPLTAKLRLRWSWRWLTHKADAVIVPSSFAMREAMRAFGLPRSMLHGIYHGVDHSTFNPWGPSLYNPHPYFLAVNPSGLVKKNLSRIREAAITTATRTGLTIDLIIADGRYSTQGLASTYRGAVGLVFPSTHETFGMPILEAMACGCPVITSNGSACAEVAGDAALLVDPRSTNDISNSMSSLLHSEEVRQRLSLAGMGRASQFTWEKTAKAHLEVFETVLGA